MRGRQAIIVFCDDYGSELAIRRKSLSDGRIGKTDYMKSHRIHPRYL